MKILFVADARSPIARNWISYFIERGHSVDVISTYPCATDLIPGARISELGVAFSNLSRVKHNGTLGSNNRRSLLTPVLASLRTGSLSGFSTAARFWLGSFEIYRHVKRARDMIAESSPDIVHAMRIPFEGILAAKAAPAKLPLVLSVWGNDFTLFARHYPVIASQTRAALRRTSALLADCFRDKALAYEFGFNREKPAVVLPGGGGVRLKMFHPGKADVQLRQRWSVPTNGPVIFCPRQFRPNFVRTDTLFKSLSIVVGSHPEATCVCVGMAGNPVAERWKRRMPAPESFRLLPAVSQTEMAELFRIAQVSVSPSTHDGTPNTLLEAMACGSFPVAGDIESIREWIVDGLNGLLCDPTSPDSLARAITRALNDSALRTNAKEHNLKLIEERADYNTVMSQAEELYSSVIQHRAAPAKV